jgi:hypothetical protein
MRIGYYKNQSNKENKQKYSSSKNYFRKEFLWNISFGFIENNFPLFLYIYFHLLSSKKLIRTDVFCSALGPKRNKTVTNPESKFEVFKSTEKIDLVFRMDFLWLECGLPSPPPKR